MVQWLIFFFTKGKGNDQIRFEMAFLAIDPKIKIIAPWRLPKFFQKFDGRQALLDYAAQTGIPVTSTKAKPYSMDDNIAHCRRTAGGPISTTSG
jgi:argininosuccinate synthase